MWTHGSHVDGSWGKIPKKRLQKRIPDGNTIKKLPQGLEGIACFQNSLENPKSELSGKRVRKKHL